MYDDDMTLCYEGRADREGFGPLQDFGTPNVGCTGIRFQDGDGNWNEL